MFNNENIVLFVLEAIKVFDGNNSFRRQLYRVITVPRTYTLEQLLTTALRAFHISRDPCVSGMNVERLGV